MPVNIRKQDGGAVVTIAGEITPFSPQRDFNAELGDATSIDVYIDSYGGCSSVAFGLHEALKDRGGQSRISSANVGARRR
jgi:hypothetical protein